MEAQLSHHGPSALCRVFDFLKEKFALKLVSHIFICLSVFYNNLSVYLYIYSYEVASTRRGRPVCVCGCIVMYVCMHVYRHEVASTRRGRELQAAFRPWGEKARQRRRRRQHTSSEKYSLEWLYIIYILGS